MGNSPWVKWQMGDQRTIHIAGSTDLAPKPNDTEN